MKIAFERSGGFAGMLITATIDTADLAAEDAQEIEQLVNDADFFSLPAKPQAASRGADQFQYKISIETADQQHTVEAGEGALPDAMRPLLRRLTVLARR